MRELPAGALDLLKSRKQIGANSPNHLITITAANPNRVDLTDPTSWTTWRYFAGATDNKGLGYMTETSDGRAVISYVENNNVYVAFAPSVVGVLEGTEVFDYDNAILVKEGNEHENIQTSLTLIEGRLHLAITNWTWVDPYAAEDWILQCEHWVDSDGQGADLAFYNYISEDLSSGTAWARELPRVGNDMGQIVCLSTTNWVIMCPWWSYVYSGNVPCYTTDGGETWHNGAHSPTSLFYYLAGNGVSVLPLSETSFVIAWNSSSSYEKLLYYTNCGATLSLKDYWGSDWPGGDDYVHGIGYVIVGENAYMASASDGSYDIYEFKLDTPTYETIKLYENWTLVASVPFLEGSDPMFTLTENALILQHKTSGSISGAGTIIETYTEKLKVKLIEVARNRGMASSLSLVLDNKGGRYSPDKLGPWHNVLFPNAQVKVEQGYGANLVQTFLGLIDDVNPTTFPHELTLHCRDYLKKALDQHINDGEGGRTVYYTDTAPETIFGYLAAAAGFTVVYVEATGLTISKGFSMETYSDAFSWLSELVGYEWYCDEAGALYYHRATDRQPAVEDWDLTFTVYDEPVLLTHLPGVNPIVGDTLVLSYDGTPYTKDVDYTFDPATSEITALSTGSIPLDQTNKISYVYAAYVFKEGQDIVSLGYTISDKDLYRQVLVIGQDADGNEITATADYISADYYNLPADKILPINAPEADTVEKCQEIADRAEYLMRSRARICEFAAIGVPWLQIGDCIQVIETSTGISEIYRITDMSLQQSPEGFYMQITCYHYGYAAAT